MDHAPAPLSLYLADETATDRLGIWLSHHLRAGDCLLLEGPIGAGKSHLARALIRARLGVPEEVPSPSFTLVQTYQADVEIWHADLYRLSHPDEVFELGLDDAFASAITLIEWPDRLGDHLPARAIRLRLSAEGDGRRVEVSAPHHPELLAELQKAWPTDRATLCRMFLDAAGWGNARREFLAADSSTRSYDRLIRGDETAVLMDAPPPDADDPAVFLTIAAFLNGCGLSAPRCLAQDLANGFLLLEDLGDGIFARLVERDGSMELPLYKRAAEVLLHLQRQQPPPGLTNLSAEDWGEAACFALDWYRFAITGERCDTAPIRTAVSASLRAHADGPRVMILRDYHAENLLWLPERTGLARVGLLDFQLAQMGQPGYDLVSLLQDARRDVSPETEAAVIAHFTALGGHEPTQFAAAYACLGAQRALRILGIFARLCLKDGKPGYLRMMPRVWGQLWRNLAAPELAELAAICTALLPPPTPENLERMGAQCGHFR